MTDFTGFTVVDLFPAYAGVILIYDVLEVLKLAFPRIRGGDP